MEDFPFAFHDRSFFFFSSFSFFFWGLFLHLAFCFQSRSIRSLHNKDVFLHNVINDHVSHQRLSFLRSVSLAISRLPSIVDDSHRAGLEGRACFFSPWNETEQVTVAWLLGFLGGSLGSCRRSSLRFLVHFDLRWIWDTGKRVYTTFVMGFAPFPHQTWIHPCFASHHASLVTPDPETIIGHSVSSHLAIRYFALLVFSYRLIFALLRVWFVQTMAASATCLQSLETSFLFGFPRRWLRASSRCSHPRLGLQETVLK